MAKYRLYKNKNIKLTSYNKYYAKKCSQGMVTQQDLIKHMAAHNCGYSEGMISAVLTDMVNHVRELAYEGKSVKIDNLGIFRVSMKSKGVADPKDFNAATDITSKWQVQPTGEVLIKSLGVTRAGGVQLTWTEDDDYTSPRTAKEASGEDNG